MKSVVLRKVPFRMAGKSRMVWAFIVAQSQGLTLLLIPKPNGHADHSLAIACENQGVFEDVAASRFPLPLESVEQVGDRLQALADNMTKAEFKRLFEMDDD